MYPSTDVIWGMRQLQRCWTSDYVAWAIGLLVAGSDSKNLRILAGLEPRSSVFEAEEHFRMTAQELLLEEPAREEAIRAYCVAIAQQIVTAELAPRLAIKKLYQICCACDYPKYLMIWFELDDACDALDYGDQPWTYPGLTADNLGETALREARSFIESNSSKPQESQRRS